VVLVFGLGIATPAVASTSATKAGKVALSSEAKVRHAAEVQTAPPPIGQVVPPPGGFPAGVSIVSEVTADRTADSRTYLTSTGQYLEMDYMAPVNYQDSSGAWQLINPALVTSNMNGYAWHDAANSVDAELPSSLSATPILVTNGTDWISFALDGASSQGAVSGDTATYPDALPGVNVSYTSEDNELKESLVLADPSAPTIYNFVVQTAAGDTLVSDGSGGLELLDADGNVAFDLPVPTMTDAAGNTSDAVTMTATQGDSGWTVTVSADSDWLGDPSRTWPVTIDPSTTFSGATYCTLEWANPTSSFCDGTTYGISSRANQNENGIIQFPSVQSTLGNASLVEAATLYLNETAASASGTVQLGSYGLTQAWNDTATWDDSMSGTAWTTAGGSSDGDETDSPSQAVTPTGSVNWTFNVQPLVQKWVSGQANDGFLILESPSSVALTFTGSGTTPYLAVTYEKRLGNEPFYDVSSHAIDDQETLGVNAADGNVIIDTTDYSVGGTGLSMQIQRTYNSRSKRTGSLGLGWSLNMGPDVSLTPEAGGSYLFDDRNGANWLFTLPLGSTTYTSPPGINANLSVSGSTATITYDTSQEVLGFTALGGSCPGMVLTTDTDRNGNKLTYDYSGCNLYTITLNRAGETLSEGRTWSVDTDTSSRIESITESNFEGGLNTSGSPIYRAVGFGYDSTHTYLTSYTDPTGQVTSYQYNSSGYMDQITNPDGHIIQFDYDSTGRVSSITYITNLTSMVGDTTTYTPDTNTLTANQNALTQDSTAGWSDFYNATLSVTTGHAEAGTYSLKAVAGSATDPNEMIVGTTAAGLPAEAGQSYSGSVYVEAASSLATATVWAQLTWYNASGGTISGSAGTAQTDSSSAWTQYTATAAAPTGAASMALAVYIDGTASGNTHYIDLAWITPGSTLNNESSPAGLPYVMGVACGSGNNPNAATLGPTIYSMGANTQTDANGNVTTYCYDGSDRVTAVVDGLGEGRGTSYSANSGVSTGTDAMTPTPGVWTYSYYSQNQLESVQAPTGMQASLGNYGTSGPTEYLPGSYTDTQGNVSQLGYDSVGNLTTNENASSQTATTNYNSDGTVENQSDFGGSCSTSTHCTSYSYTYASTDPTVLTTKVTTPPSPQGAITATYDIDTRLSSTVDGNGYKTVYCYDNDNRIVKVFYNVTTTINCVTTTSPAPDMTYTYDGDGNLTQKVDNDFGGTTTSYGYDNLDRPVTELTGATECTFTLPGTSTIYDGTSCITYDAVGNVASYTDSGGTVSYTFDAANENTTVLEPGGTGGCYVNESGTIKTTEPKCTAFAYNDDGVRVETLYPSGELISTTTDGSSRIKTTTSVYGSTTIANLTYTYTNSSGGDSGLLRTKTDGVADTTTTYGYDPDDHLCWAATESGSGTPTTFSCTPPSGSGISVQSYVYDKYGNMETQTSTTGAVTSYGTDNADELCWSITATESSYACSLDPSGSTIYASDADGNMTTTTAGTAVYNAANQTTSIDGSSFTYGDAGQTDRLTSGSNSYFNSLNGLASAVISGTTYYFTRDADGDLIGMRNGAGGSSTNYYYTTDNLGSIIAMNDANGVTDATYSYDPYGNTTIGTNVSGLATTNRWRYAGGWWDGTEQMYHFGARYYDPSIGRFLQLDPTGRSSGYAYANDNPITNTDPSGEFNLGEIFAGIATIVGVDTLTVFVAGISLLGAPEDVPLIVATAWPVEGVAAAANAFGIGLIVAGS
jgi:RHS repeat-associated protein